MPRLYSTILGGGGAAVGAADVDAAGNRGEVNANKNRRVRSTICLANIRETSLVTIVAAACVPRARETVACTDRNERTITPH